MTRDEIKKKRQELTVILKEADARTRRKQLDALACEVGASVTRVEWLQTAPRGHEYRDVITETEIVHNIEQALQTWTMLDMCRTASRNFWIALIASLMAVVSAVAAWVSAGAAVAALR